MALTPTASTAYSSVILSALATAITRNSTTGQGRQLSMNPTYVQNAVTQDSTPYTSKKRYLFRLIHHFLLLDCVFPFALVLVDYNFCIPYEPNFICSRSRVIDRNASLDSIDCSRNSSSIQQTTFFFLKLKLIFLTISSLQLYSTSYLFSKYMFEWWYLFTC